MGSSVPVTYPFSSAAADSNSYPVWGQQLGSKEFCKVPRSIVARQLPASTKRICHQPGRSQHKTAVAHSAHGEQHTLLGHHLGDGESWEFRAVQAIAGMKEVVQCSTEFFSCGFRARRSFSRISSSVTSLSREWRSVFFGSSGDGGTICLSTTSSNSTTPSPK